MYSHCHYRAPILLPAATQLGQAPNSGDPHATLTTEGCLMGTSARRGPKGEGSLQPCGRLKSGLNLGISHSAAHVRPCASGDPAVSKGRAGPQRQLPAPTWRVGAILLSALATGKQVRLCATCARHLVLKDGLLGHGLADLLQPIASHLLGLGHMLSLRSPGGSPPAPLVGSPLEVTDTPAGRDGATARAPQAGGSWHP